MKFLWTTFIFLLIVAIFLIFMIRYAISMNQIEEKKDDFLFCLASKDDPWIEPRLISNFLTAEECDSLVKESDRIGFADSKVENFVVDPNVRTSKTCWVYPEHTPFLQTIYDRVKELPEIQELGNKAVFEACQVVQYKEGQQYKAHYDQCYEDKPFCKKQLEDFKGPRKWTLLMYISDECEGGETFFPNLGLKVKPKKGDALLFHSLTKDNKKVHPLSFHQGSPVKSGEKRIANVWIRRSMS